MPGSKVVVVETEEYLQKRRKELTSHGLFDDVPMEEDSQAGAPAVAEEHDEVKRQIEAIRGEVDDLNAQVRELQESAQSGPPSDAGDSRADSDKKLKIVMELLTQKLLKLDSLDAQVLPRPDPRPLCPYVPMGPRCHPTAYSDSSQGQGRATLPCAEAARGCKPGSAAWLCTREAMHGLALASLKISARSMS
eukprot:CAMPEP_0177594806 /NCGR_PEP_ID=MMETSP0419_2-20121207/9987_1 /TAXON_ID=582737 /ORGANISM="Tetraselmis sp., Strain GSL018" /LENGTH=191 /DNA_ID=CAMNT_0019086159 /DNA_START=344 /DNA_END=920 /DNA_ORIENTATION=+